MSQRIFKVIFQHMDQVFEIYAKQIYQSELYSFIEVEELLFGEKTQVIVDPAEEKLKTEFLGVKRSYIPIHSVIRIDEVESQGEVKITEHKKGNNVQAFPKMPGRPEKGD
ncbi:MAG: DUF1820 family protein [Cellvibrionales bacterium]|nr:DUF1820 family protein [Cellvibrionales bacterium]